MTDFLIGDIGGTNARLALADSESFKVHQQKTFSSRDFPNLLQVVQAYLRDLPVEIDPPREACFAVASPIRGEQVSFTNNPWTFSVSELKSQLPLDTLKVINDFYAVAMSLPYLKAEDLVQLAPWRVDATKTLAVMGPGTGLGMAILADNDGRKFAIPTEGGHAGFAPSDHFECEIWKIFFEEQGFVSREDLLSGQGLVSLAQAIATIEGMGKLGELRPQDITELALQGDLLATKTLDSFCAILGSCAGDFALQSGARGGVFLAGGILPRIQDFFLQSRFREKFEAKARFRDYVHDIPTVLIVAGEPGLIGAAATLKNIEPA